MRKINKGRKREREKGSDTIWDREKGKEPKKPALLNERL